MIKLRLNPQINIYKPIQPIKIEKEKFIDIPEEKKSFENELKKIEKEKFIKPSIEKQKKTLKEKSEEMESILVYQMLKTMKPKLSESLFGGGKAEEIWSDMLYEEYAKQMSNTANFGLATQIYNELTKNYFR
ncbi:MAG TPA: rod-binding protein [bacterium]|nr:rod-binding protein [bacterium]HOL48306.1 rod-binding protein [bacterium]HPQ19806.1 rod-binding protein [bacterium]